MNNLQSATTPAAERKYQVSVNRNIINKTVRKERFYTQGFEKRDVTIPELLGGVVSQGYAHTCGVFRANRRIESNYRFAQLVEIDIDGELTLEQANDHPIIKKFGRGIYTTSSHQISKDGNPGVDRYRVVFASPRPITSAKGYRAVQAELLSRIKEADQACKDPLRPWFGNTNTEYWILDGEDLDQEILDAATERMRQQEQKEKEQEQERERLLEDLYSSNDRDSLFKVAVDLASYVPPRQKSGNTYPDLLTLKAGLVSLLGREDAANVLDITHPADSSQGWRGGDEIRRDRTLRGTSPKRIYDMAKKHGYQGANPFKRENPDSGLSAIFEMFKRKREKIKRQAVGFGERKRDYTLKQWRDVVEWFRKGHRLDAIRQKLEDGFKLLVLACQMGTGKTYDLGRCLKILQMIDPEYQVVYVDKNYRNPATKTIEENSTEIRGRSVALTTDNTRHTELGQPYLVTAKEGDDVVIEANCKFPEFFFSANEKNLRGTNQGCKGCPWFSDCDYRKQLQQNMKQYFKRCSPAMLHLFFSNDVDVSKTFFVFEEAGVTMPFTKEIKIPHKDILKLFDIIENDNPEIYDDIAFIKRISLQAIRDNEDSKKLKRNVDTLKLGTHGIKDQTYREWYKDQIKEITTESIESVKLATEGLLDSVFEESDSVKGAGTKYRDSADVARKLMAEDAMRGNVTRMENLPVNGLYELLAVCVGLLQGSVRLSKEGFTVKLPNEDLKKLYKRSAGFIALDSTPILEFYELALGLEESETAVIAQEEELLDIEVVAVEMFGMGSNNISETVKRHKKTIKQKIQEIHPDDIAFFDWKKYAEEMEADGAWFVDTRSYNGVSGKSIAAFGTFQKNLGAVWDDWIALGGDESIFPAIYKRLEECEIEQFIGRARANRHRGKEQKAYIITTDAAEKTEFIKGQVRKYTTMHATELCPTVRQGAEGTTALVVYAMADFLRQGIDISREKLAESTGFSVRTISRVLQVAGGLKKCANSLLDSFNRELAHFDQAVDDYLSSILAIDPFSAMKEVSDHVKTHGWQSFLELAELASDATRAKILSALLIFLPDFHSAMGIDDLDFGIDYTSFYRS